MVSDDDLEVELRFVRGHAAGSLAGVFGPDSATWRVNKEAAIFLGAGRALLLQLAHPWVTNAVAEHSQVFAPVPSYLQGHVCDGLRHTRSSVGGGATLTHRRHAAITGVMPRAAGPYAPASRYQANEASALLWVHATLIETRWSPAISSFHRFRPRIGSRVFAALFGIPQASLPSNWQDFAAYNNAMWESETLAVIPEARAMAEQVSAEPTFASAYPSGTER